MFFFTDESSLIDSQLRKRVCFTNVELGSDVLKSGTPFFPSISLDLNLNLCILEAFTSKDPLASNILLRPLGFLPQVTPISSHWPAPTHDALPRPSACELFKCLCRSRRPEEPRPSAHELFNRLSQSRRPEVPRPSACELFNRLPSTARPSSGSKTPGPL